MSVDSLKVWQAAILPDVYLNDHPVLNVLLYKYLYQLWGNPAIVAVAQVILMALLFRGLGFGYINKVFQIFVVAMVPVGRLCCSCWLLQCDAVEGHTFCSARCVLGLYVG